MPIKIPDGLPATGVLRQENIFVMTEQRATTQDIRPLKILLVNLMPLKIQTEVQLSRLLGNTPLQVELEFVSPASHQPSHTPAMHLQTFYKTFEEVKDRYFDGCIITGAPVELLEFEEVDYWEELCDIMDWTRSHVHSTLHICWGAQAGLYHHYGIRKHTLEKKLSGIYSHQVEYRNSILFRGFDDWFQVPHSRNTTVNREDIEAVPELRILASSPEAGPYCVFTKNGRQIFITGHPEYDAGTLQYEYERDRNQGIDPQVPEHYFPEDDPGKPPISSWRAHANLLFSNWLNYIVYQTTPYDLQTLQDRQAVQTDGAAAQTGTGR